MKRGRASRGRLNRLTVVMACQCMALIFASGDALALPPQIYYDLTLQIQDEAKNPGTLSPAAGVRTYLSGTQVTLEATPNAGWVFRHWRLGEETIDANPCAITLDSDRLIVAVFTERFSLSPTVVGKGTIAVEPELPEYAGGARVQLTATPAAEWTFSHWECPGDLSVDGATVSPVDVVVDRDGKIVTAVFRSAHELVVATLGGGSVALNPDPGGHVANVAGGAQTFHYNADMTVELTPIPDAGHEMGCWVMVSKLNTVWIDYNPGPVYVKMEVYRSVTAMFKPKEGHSDATTDFVVPVLGPGQVVVEYPNRPARLTSSLVRDSVPAGETVTATAVAADPDAGVFTCWEIVSGGQTTYVTDETIEITADTSATALYLGYADPKAVFVSPVSTRVLGEGSISIGEGTFMFSTYNVPGDPRSGFSTLHLFATPAPGWVFKQWWNVPDDLKSTHVTLSLLGSHDVIAEFVERQGMDALDFTGDFQAFLTDIKDRVELESPGILEFDTGLVEYISGKPRVKLLPNGIPDVAELALLQGILQDPKFELSHAGGVSHTQLWEYYQTNLARATEELASLEPHIQRLTAAYMTLGSFGHRETMPYYLNEIFGVQVNPDRYQLWAGRRFDERGDVDNDGKWNVEEWRNTVKASNGVVDMDTVARFVAAAMNRESDGLDQDDGLGPNEFRFHWPVVPKVPSTP